MKKVNWKMLSIVLVLILAFTMIPTTVFASAQTVEGDTTTMEDVDAFEINDEPSMMLDEEVEDISALIAEREQVISQEPDAVVMAAKAQKDGYEDNNTYRDATRISVHPDSGKAPKSYYTSIYATIHQKGDVDFYRFEVYGDAKVTISLSNIPTAADYDLTLFMFPNTAESHSNGDMINLSNNEGRQWKYGGSEKIEKELEPNSYYIKVDSPDTYDATNKYKLELTVKYIDTQSVSIKDLRYNKGCKAALWRSDFDPCGAKPFKQGAAHVGTDIYVSMPNPPHSNPFLTYMTDKDEVEHASLYIWDNAVCSGLIEYLDNYLLPDLIENKNKSDAGRLEYSIDSEIVDGVCAMINIICVFIPDGTTVGDAAKFTLGAGTIIAPYITDSIFSALYPNMHYNYDELIARTQSIIKALRQKAALTDDSQVLKISTVYSTTTVFNAIAKRSDDYASWYLKLPETDFLYESDLINASSEKSCVFGHIYGLRNKNDYENAINKKRYALEYVNSSPAETVKLTETHNRSLNEGEYHWYKFTAPSDGYYDFFTEGQNIDTFGELFNNEVVAQSTTGCIQYDDDSGVGKNFNIHRKLDVGKTIYIRVRGYNWGKQETDYSFKVRRTSSRIDYSANASDFSSFVNANGQGQYFFYEKQQTVELDGLNVNTKRLRCGFIENNYLVLSAYRQNAGTAYLELNFDEQLKSISFNIGLWGTLEKIDSTNSTVLLQYKNTSGEWISIIDFMKVGLSTRFNGLGYYIPLEVYDTKDIRIIVNVTNPSGSQNRGRVMLDNLNFGI